MFKIFNLLVLTTLATSISFAKTEKKTTTYSSYAFSSAEPYEASITATQGNFTSVGSTSSNSIALEAYYQHWDKIQIGGRLGSNNNGVKTISALAAIGVYNFDSDLKQSIFAYGGLGSYDSNSGFIIGGGKRFTILNKLNWAPKIEIAKYGSADTMIVLTPINVTVFFSSLFN